jgi:hypothetical protein
MEYNLDLHSRNHASTGPISLLLLFFFFTLFATVPAHCSVTHPCLQVGYFVISVRL